MEFEKALENVLQNLGFNHWLYFLAISSVQIFGNPHITAMAFLGKTPGFSCNTDKEKKLDPCKSQCDKYVFEKNYTSISTEWNLVCDESYKVPLAQEILMFGFLLGVVVLGSGSDKMGRLRTLMICLYIQVIAQASMLFCTSYFQFALSRFLLGFTAGGSSLTSYVIIMENILSHHRALAGTVGQIAFALGNVTFSLMAFYIRDWRMLSLAIAVTNVPFLFLSCFIPESPRWLMSEGRISEAEDALYRVGKMSNPTFNRQMVSITETKEEGPKASSGTFDAFRTPEIRRRLLALMFAWFTCSFVYYGLTMNATSQGSNMYVSFALSGLVEVPAHLICTVALNRIGRKRCLFLAFFTGGLSCLFVDFTSSTSGLFSPLSLSLVGKMGIAMAFNGIYLFSLELFPTVIRNGAMGLCSMAARVGGIAAPLLSNYGEDITFVGFGVTGVISGLLMLMLPETLGLPLPETIDDVECWKSI
ncbi:putative solute carrier family 22 member 15-like [Apostichopus japonicus]|uniref:Putative solute carrier family 22 member 15-like n=1 Tax=Stichopus japonicus TaxID=307972 RepID=A0A2G8JMD5_STIJA|nr:putative solute carrier family 22 member 15-like [Apostichopus japonicus]